MFTAALIVTASKWKQPERPSRATRQIPCDMFRTSENRTRGVNKLQPPPRRMCLTDIMLSEGNQTKEHTPCDSVEIQFENRLG